MQGPLTSWLDHEYWMCQHLQVSLRTSAGKLINVYNVHSPGSNKHPLTPTVRADILEWFATNAAKPALIGGDLKSSRLSLDAVFKDYRDIHYCYEKNHFQGDVVIARGLDAESMPCEVMSTSKEHRMCVVTVPMEPYASKPYAPGARLERLLVKATEIRERYQRRLHDVGDCRDLDFDRSLTTKEMWKVHNAWMNYVSA